MGPNGAGKSTFANIISGTSGYNVVDGDIKFGGVDITKMSCDKRARIGIFMSMQHPIEIPGVSWNSFLKASVCSTREEQKISSITAIELIKKIKEKAKLLNINSTLLRRDVNDGFSGGEKKKFEILQMLLLKPRIAILDEIDSGLDVDSLRLISKNINAFKDNNNAIIIITHYNKILEYIVPDFVHIFYGGIIVKSGDYKLAKVVENEGYDKFK